jgi:Family of unknown function (DUF6350)
VTRAGLSAQRAAVAGGANAGSAGTERALFVTGVLAAGAVTIFGLAVITVLVLAGWITAPHAQGGLLAVLRTAAALWLVGNHVGIALRGVGRIGMLPLGLVLLPGFLLWRAGGWVVRAGQVRRLRHVGYATLALAVPYALAAGALALASRSAQESSSVPQALVCGLLLPVVAGGLGGARALAPWSRLAALLPQRPRALVLGIAGMLATLVAAGAVLAGSALAIHLNEASRLERSLAPGAVGAVLLLLLELGYLPNAIVWAISFSLGPGFAFGASTVVTPTGSALTQLPALPLLAALPPGLHAAMPGWLEPTVLALPYLAGLIGGLLLSRSAPGMPLDAAPVWGLACGVACGCLLGLLAAFSGGPLGGARLAAIGPSGWQAAVVGALELGVSAAISAGVANYLGLRRTGSLARADDHAAPAKLAPASPGWAGDPAASGHVIFLDPWAGDRPSGTSSAPAGPSALP